MGLRFRRSISLCKGVKLNFGLKGVSISSGIPGFRRTVHSSGRVTTSIGIPGSGMYYTTTSNPSKKKEAKTGGLFSGMLTDRPNKDKSESADNGNKHTESEHIFAPTYSLEQSESSKEEQNTSLEAVYSTAEHKTPIIQSINIEEEKEDNKVTQSAINTIFEQCDYPVNWIDVISNLRPTNELINLEAWTFLHKCAVNVIEGDIDTYLEVIRKINPYNDILEYADNIEFGTDSSDSIEVEYSIMEEKLQKSLDICTYNLILKDYICSVSIRIARDTFALLPIETVIVTAKLNYISVVSVKFNRKGFVNLCFEGKDASDLINAFDNNMSFDKRKGFSEIRSITDK